jgi:hypothetical protein
MTLLLHDRLNRTGVIARWRCQSGVVGRDKGRIGPLQSYNSKLSCVGENGIQLCWGEVVGSLAIIRRRRAQAWFKLVGLYKLDDPEIGGIPRSAFSEVTLVPEHAATGSETTKRL